MENMFDSVRCMGKTIKTSQPAGHWEMTTKEHSTPSRFSNSREHVVVVDDRYPCAAFRHEKGLLTGSKEAHESRADLKGCLLQVTGSGVHRLSSLLGLQIGEQCTSSRHCK